MFGLLDIVPIFSSPERSSGIAVALPQASGLAQASAAALAIC